MGAVWRLATQRVPTIFVMADETPQNPTAPAGGVIHTYQKYDPMRFPMPAAEPPDLVSPAFEHLLAYGSLDELTDAELAEAIEIDPSQIAGLGPSLGALLAMLEERKRQILARHETDSVRKAADRQYRDTASRMSPPRNLRDAFTKAVNREQIRDLEELWYRVDQRSDFGRQMVQLTDHLGNKYQVEELAAKYAFIGKQPMTVPQALEIKDELETIDRLIQQLKDAAKNAKLYVINLDELARFADEGQLDEMAEMQRRVADLLREMAEQQGLRRDADGYRLTPKAFKLFQTKLLGQIFADLQAAKSGRHQVEITGDGAVEMQRTKPYEFGDSLANIDVGTSLVNAMIREAGERAAAIDPAQPIIEWAPNPAQPINEGPPDPASRFADRPTPRGVRLRPEDIEIHQTRNNPKCATVVCMDMSGSMRWGGQYINVKRMALALHGLIRSEYPGDFVDFVEICTLPRRRHISEVPELLPRPVTTHDPVVRLKADLSDPRISEYHIHPHFTNIQQGLRLARQMLQVQDTPNRQIIVITDGLPTAHFEDKWLYMLYPPDPRTEAATLREGLACREQGIVINLFLLAGWSQTREDIQFAQRLAEGTTGRVIFTAGRELDRFVVWDYVKRRRMIVG